MSDLRPHPCEHGEFNACVGCELELRARVAEMRGRFGEILSAIVAMKAPPQEALPTLLRIEDIARSALAEGDES
jgi:hypothetical protein